MVWFLAGCSSFRGRRNNHDDLFLMKLCYPFPALVRLCLVTKCGTNATAGTSSVHNPQNLRFYRNGFPNYDSIIHCGNRGVPCPYLDSTHSQSIAQGWMDGDGWIVGPLNLVHQVKYKKLHDESAKTRGIIHQIRSERPLFFFFSLAWRSIGLDMLNMDICFVPFLFPLLPGTQFTTLIIVMAE